VGLAGSVLVAASSLRPVLAVGVVPARRRDGGAVQHAQHFRTGDRDQAYLQAGQGVAATVTGLLRRLDDWGTGADRQRALDASGVSTPAFITALARATLSGYQPGRSTFSGLNPAR